MNRLHRGCRIEQQHVDAASPEQTLGARRQASGQPDMAFQKPRRTHQEVYISAASVVVEPGAEQQNFAIGADLIGELFFQGQTLFSGQAHATKCSVPIRLRLAKRRDPPVGLVLKARAESSAT